MVAPMRSKGNMKYEVVETNGNINEETGLKGDYTIFLTGLKNQIQQHANRRIGVAFIKAKLNSPYSITEVATLISVSALEKADLKELLTAPSDLLESNQNVKEPELFE